MSATISNGAPDPLPPPARWRGWLPLIALGLAVVVTLACVLPTLGPLMVLLFPPSAPQPAGARTADHVQLGWGYDLWRVEVDQPACDVVAFYRAQGAACELSPGWCVPQPADAPRPDSRVGRCDGRVPTAGFALRYQAELLSRGATTTMIRLEREVLWNSPAQPNS